METFETSELAGWVRPGAADRRVLLLHGGPGLSHDYLLPLVDDLPGWTVASFQQRGLAPSTTDGPFDFPTAVADVLRVLDALDWDRPLVAGHSWGGPLAWHVAVSLGEGLEDRVGGVLAIDPVGAVGDMGLPAFIDELHRRLTPESERAVAAWELIEEERPLTEAEAIEEMALLWPAYFADPARVPPFPDTRFSTAAFAGLTSSAVDQQPALLAGLPLIRVPMGALVGGGSPIPASASTETMALVPGAWTETAAGAGHFVWFERPGAVAASLERLLA